MAYVVAIQHGIDLANGKGLIYSFDIDTMKWVETDCYQGSAVASLNDNSRRPLLWTNRHCRICDDPYGGSVAGTKPASFKVCTVQDGRIGGNDLDSFYYIGKGTDGKGNLLGPLQEPETNMGDYDGPE